MSPVLDGPTHVDWIVVDGEIHCAELRGDQHGGYDVSLSMPDDSLVSLGHFESYAAATAAARKRVTGPADPLSRWRSGYNLMVVRQRTTGKWNIIAAGSRGYADTGLYLETESEARELVKNIPCHKDT